MTDPEVKNLVGEYLAVLDEETHLQEAAVGHLKRMSAAMASRDEPAMETLFREADEAHERFARLEARRQVTAGRLAAAIRCDNADLTLKRLARELPAPEGQAVEACRRRLQAVVGEIRRQHLKTVAMLGESARLNRALITGLFAGAGGTPTYGASGKSPAWPGGGLLDTRS